MPIVFADEARRRRNRRVAVRWTVVGAVAGVTALSAYALAGRGDPSGGARSAHVEPEAHLAPSEPPRSYESSNTDTETEISQNDREAPNTPGAINCEVTDGDTLNCGGRRIRLIGIDAPELPGHCQEWRDCVKGDPFASSLALQRLIQTSDLQIVVLGRDKYERELANVYASGKNVACHLIAGGYVVYVAKWDEGGTVMKDCSISEL